LEQQQEEKAKVSVITSEAKAEVQHEIQAIEQKRASQSVTIEKEDPNKKKKGGKSVGCCSVSFLLLLLFLSMLFLLLFLLFLSG
jgi:hypothetical protein